LTRSSNRGARRLQIGLNVMFGLPGETREDFEQLKQLLNDYAAFKDRIIFNPALNFCYFPEGCDVSVSPDTYGVDLTLGELYWFEKNGANDFLSRLAKFEEFCALARRLGYANLFG